MSAYHTGNSLIPTQRQHDTQHGSARSQGLLTLGRLGIFYVHDPEADDYEIDDIKLAPDPKPANHWRNTHPGARLIDAIKAVLTAQGSSFAELIAELRNPAQEEPA